ncbi:sugar phosphate nucleotidyltransferase [Kluyvera georgiana]|uniref:sugar phosphate nucleotidyltransferase n=1 Tax=Kluyvera georgiana TaxID=73098 RepID=UPI0032203D15
MMNILVLAASEHYIDSADKNYPLCLSEIKGKPLVQIIAENINFNEGRTCFLFQDKHIKKYRLDNIVKLLSNDKFESIAVPEDTAGAACTALLGVVSLEQELPLLIISANQLIDIDYEELCTSMKNSGYDAGTIIFDSVHPRYSYVILEDNLVVEASEKNPISRNATAGVYWFNKTDYFTQAVKQMIRKDARVDQQFYICPSLNELVLQGMKIGVHRIDTSKYHPLKSQSHVENIKASDENI